MTSPVLLYMNRMDKQLYNGILIRCPLLMVVAAGTHGKLPLHYKQNKNSNE